MTRSSGFTSCILTDVSSCITQNGTPAATLTFRMPEHGNIKHSTSVQLNHPTSMRIVLTAIGMWSAYRSDMPPLTFFELLKGEVGRHCKLHISWAGECPYINWEETRSFYFPNRKKRIVS